MAASDCMFEVYCVDAETSNRPGNLLNWTTLSCDACASELPVLKVFSSSLEVPASSEHHNHVPAARSKSVSNLEEEKLRLSDDDIRQIRNRLVIFARNRALFRQLAAEQKWVLMVICLCYFMSFSAISVMSPFFLEEALLHNVSSTTYGLIFSVHPLVVFCTSPFIGQIIPSIGPKFMFVCGVFLCGACNLLFGVLECVEDDAQFVMLCFVVRGLSAVGASAFSTAGATFIADLFPNKICVIMGVLETFIGLGFSVGPVIGGSLYTLGGFRLPFFVLGGLMVATLPLNLCLLPSRTQHDVDDGRSKASVVTIFRQPSVMIVCLVVAVSSSAWSVLEPTLVIHMKEFDMTSFHLGLLFLLTSFSYAVSSPFWGWICDKYDQANFMMIIGLLMTAFSLLLLGPSSVFSGILCNTLWLNILSLILLGIFVSMAYLPTYHALLHYAKDVGCDSQLSTYSVVAGLWASMYSLGEVIGPSLGGFLVDFYDFPMAMTVVACLNVTVACLLMIYRAVNFLVHKRRQRSLETTTTTQLKCAVVDDLAEESLDKMPHAGHGAVVNVEQVVLDENLLLLPDDQDPITYGSAPDH